MKTFMVRGVPHRLQQDGWWFNSPDTAQAGPETPGKCRGHLIRLAVLVALIAVGDALYWGTNPGASLAVFAGLCMAAAFGLSGRGQNTRRVLLAVGVTVLSVLPVVELVQPLSLLFLFAGLPVAVGVLTGRTMVQVPKMWLSSFHSADVDVTACVQGLGELDMGGIAKRASVQWALPLGVGLVFVALLLQANPVLGHWAGQAMQFEVSVPDVSRVCLWAGLLLLVWPFVAFSRVNVPVPARAGSWQGPLRRPKLLNGPAVLRSLAVFNILFAVQNAMDLSVLSGGARLPDGVSYATYAHQGAYPLLALALLSGGFAIVARPFVPAAPLIKPLLLIWVAQTIWLCCSAGLRLDLYVETYGLTRLRMAAGIWMGLVAAGLGLVLWQIGHMRNTGWLVRRVAGMGLLTLYLCCFWSFDRAIAHYNLTHDVPLDRAYLCALGEAAIPEISTFANTGPSAFCLHEAGHPILSQPSDWREWGFRNTRVRRSLARLQHSLQASQ